MEIEVREVFPLCARLASLDGDAKTGDDISHGFSVPAKKGKINEAYTNLETKVMWNIIFMEIPRVNKKRESFSSNMALRY